MSSSPEVGAGTWMPPEPPVHNQATSIDHFQAQTTIREQNVEELTRVCNVLRDTKSKFESNELSSEAVLSILSEFKSAEFKIKHPDANMLTALAAAITSFEKEVSVK